MRSRLKLDRWILYKVFTLLIISIAQSHTIVIDPTSDNDCSDGLCKDIKLALEEAENNDYPTYIIIKAGTYEISSTLIYNPTKAKNLVIMGEDPTNPPIIKPTASSEPKPLLFIQNPEEDTEGVIKIQNIIFSDTVNTKSLPSFLYIKTVKYTVEISECKFLNGQGAKGIEIQTSSGDIHFVNNALENININGNFLDIRSTSGKIVISLNKTIPTVSSKRLINLYTLNSQININRNELFNGGGQILNISTLKGTAFIEKNILKDASAPQEEGGALHVYMDSGELILRNNLLHSNSAGRGGGAFIKSKSTYIYVINNTLSNNSADLGGGLYIQLIEDNAMLKMYNNIVWGNSSTNGTGDDVYIDNDGDLNNTGSNIELIANNLGNNANFDNPNSEDLFIVKTDNYTHSNNLTSDPLFNDPANGDFSLQNNSPLIDSGVSSKKYVPEEDIKGNLRNTPDIGAFEVTQTNNPDIYVFPEFIDFGNIVENSSVSLSLFVKNYGKGNLNISGVNITGSQEFSMNETCSGSALAENNTCRITITFSPQNEGTFSASITINSDDPMENTKTVQIKGNGVKAIPIINAFIGIPKIISNIGNVVNTTVRIENKGFSELSVSNIYVEGDTYGEFTIAYTQSSNPCGNPPFTLDKGGKCEVTLLYEPQVEEFKLIYVVIESNDPTNGTVKLPLYAKGETSTSTLVNVNITPNEYNFGTVLTEFTSDILTIYVENRGETGLNYDILQVNGVSLENGEHFLVVEDNCKGKLLRPFIDSCNIKVIFKPLYEGKHKDTLFIYTDLGIYEVKLTGKSIKALNLKVTPSALDFGGVRVGQESKTLPLNLYNEGPVDIKLRNIYPGDRKYFFIKENKCGKVLKVGNSCTLELYFKPTNYGTYTSHLIIEVEEPKQYVYKVELKAQALKKKQEIEIREIVLKRKGCSQTNAGWYLLMFLLIIHILKGVKRKYNTN